LVGLFALPQAPEVRIVDAEPAFSDCLSLRPKVTLGDVEDSISLGRENELTKKKLQIYLW